MVRYQKEIRVQVASSFDYFAVAAKFAHCLNSGIDPGSAKIFSRSFIGELCGQSP
ncbi:MAG TPA: hypothetical protein VG488_08290 [Candidatus Angelobacter sp.]|nr:hypothetical protein [Candidatus Angelobacter sp.]